MLYEETKVVRSTLKALEEKKELIIQCGGTSSGKTYGIMVALVRWAIAQTEKKTITVCAVNFPYIRRDTLKAFKEIIPEYESTHQVTILLGKSESNYTYQVGNCIFEFIGLEDPGKASHGKRDVLYINEAYLLPYMVYQNLAIRSTNTTILDYNPHEDFWLQEQVIPYQKPGTYLFKRSTYKDNPAVHNPEDPTFSSKIGRQIESLKDSNPNLYRVLGLGLTGRLEGLVFPNVTLVDSFPVNCKREGFGMDFGYANDPTTVVRAGVYLGGLYLHEYIYETGLLNSDIINMLYEGGVTEKDLIVADSEDPKSIAEIRTKGGFRIIPATKGKDSISHGITLINQYPIFIVKSSTNLIKEQKNYRYKQDIKTGKYTNIPMDQYNHGWDGIRYIASHILTPKIIGSRRVATFSR